MYTLDSASTDRLFCYKATDKYIGDLRSTYYQTLNFTLSYTTANVSQLVDREVILRGNDAGYELRYVPSLLLYMTRFSTGAKLGTKC